jgi:hypothetical protein
MMVALQEAMKASMPLIDRKTVIRSIDKRLMRQAAGGSGGSGKGTTRNDYLFLLV